MKHFIRRMAAVLAVIGLIAAVYVPSSAEAAASSDLIIVNKKTNKLAFYSEGKLVKEFPVATGKTRELTPEGIFPIVNKIKNRPYYKEHIPGGDPANPLGDRWLGLEVNGTKGTTYAIHGNNNERSIGKYVSAGCIRMHNDDIHWLFPRVQRNTKVYITSSSQSMDTLAAKAGYRLNSKTFAGSLVVNGQKIRLSDPMLIEDARVYVPLRETAKALGAGISVRADGVLTLSLGGRTIVHRPLASTALVNGANVRMTASTNENGRLMIALKDVPALFGVQVKWSGSAKTATLTR